MLSLVVRKTSPAQFAQDAPGGAIGTVVGLGLPVTVVGLGKRVGIKARYLVAWPGIGMHFEDPANIEPAPDAVAPELPRHADVVAELTARGASPGVILAGGPDYGMGET